MQKCSGVKSRTRHELIHNAWIFYFMDENSAQKEQHRIGTFMMVAMWLLLFVIVFLFFNRLLEKQNNPNQVLSTRYVGDTIREIVLERNRYGHYVTTGSINNQEVVFMIDTGASGVAIPEHIASKLGLKRGPAMDIQTANGIARAYLSTLQSVAVGDIELENVKAVINPNDSMDEILLGMSFLKDIEFTQRGDTLILRQHVAVK